MADLLRGDYRQSDYGKVILPFALLRRLDCVLEPTEEAVLKEYDKRKGTGVDLYPFLTKKDGEKFYNTSTFTLPTVANSFANGFSWRVAKNGGQKPAEVRR